MYLKVLRNLILISILAISACKKGTNPAPDEDEKRLVYIVGNGYNTDTYTKAMTFTWQNRKVEYLQSTEEDKGFFINTCMAVNNKDICIGGNFRNPAGIYAAYNKKGTIEILGPGNLFDIAVDGNDVYAVGMLPPPSYQYVYWKNKTYTPLENIYMSGETGKMVVKDHNVYIAGRAIGDDNLTSLPVYFRNGKINYLPINKGESGGALDIAFKGDDMYVTGYTVLPNKQRLATYWKNGQRNYLAFASDIACITVYKNDIYMGGIENDQGVRCWKNNELILKTSGWGDWPGAITYYCKDIFVYEDDVYMAGYETRNDNRYINSPVYWKNQEKINLPLPANGRTGQALGIAVMPK